ncbi:hypothetical protein ACFVS2_25135 [Brevibacillus sp. NPDC058079]|uniref:hypothetical protein n=1 Tax=Brevibacillus sp. NPDC058079 TaxID=3346330 RepID=UPI0036EEBAA3
MSLKKGDKVVMHTCGEATYYNGKIWICSSDEFSTGEGIYKQDLVFLEGYDSSFLTKYLQKVDIGMPYSESMNWFAQMELESPKLAQMIHFCHAAYNRGHGTSYTLYEFLDEILIEPFMVHGIGGGENRIDVEEIVIQLKLDQLYEDYNIDQRKVIDVKTENEIIALSNGWKKLKEGEFGMVHDLHGKFIGETDWVNPDGDYAFLPNFTRKEP